jgi:hypothetical protein
MPVGERFDFFLSRRGSVAAVAREVADVLTGKGYKVIVQDYDIPLTANFIEAMHEAIKNARDLVVLLHRTTRPRPIPARNSRASRRSGCKAPNRDGLSSSAARTFRCAVSSHPTSIRTSSASTTGRSAAAASSRRRRATPKRCGHRPGRLCTLTVV